MKPMKLLFKWLLVTSPVPLRRWKAPMEDKGPRQLPSPPLSIDSKALDILCLWPLGFINSNNSACLWAALNWKFWPTSCPLSPQDSIRPWKKLPMRVSVGWHLYRSAEMQTPSTSSWEQIVYLHQSGCARLCFWTFLQPEKVTVKGWVWSVGLPHQCSHFFKHRVKVVPADFWASTQQRKQSAEWRGSQGCHLLAAQSTANKYPDI